jgi:phosphate transport system substrate-binding protein
MKLFCSGVGTNYPDITNSSRRIKMSEFKKCQSNGVNDIIEVQVGYDGIVIANSVDATPIALSRKDIFLALAAKVPAATEGELMDNPYNTWQEVKSAYKALCHTIREDGKYIEVGENDNLIVQKLQANPAALGVFGFSFLDQNADKVQGATIEAVEPTFDSIADKSYPISRPLYFYVKKAHVGVVPGIKGYLNEFTSERAWGEDGYLAEKGMIPLPDKERRAMAKNTRSLTPMTGNEALK